jgi:hypothetical protein
MCLCISAIMVLNRLLNYALDFDRRKAHETSHQHSPPQHALIPSGDRLWLLAFKIASCIVVSFGVTGICCGLADAVFYSAQQDHMIAASDAVNATSGKDTPQSQMFKQYSDAAGFFQADARSAQHVCEVIPLSILILMFSFVGRKRYGLVYLLFSSQDMPTR